MTILSKRTSNVKNKEEQMTAFVDKFKLQTERLKIIETS